MNLIEGRKVTFLYLAPRRLETGTLSQIEGYNQIGLRFQNLTLLRKTLSGLVLMP